MQLNYALRRKKKKDESIILIFYAELEAKDFNRIKNMLGKVSAESVDSVNVKIKSL